MTRDEMRFLRREIINRFLQEFPYKTGKWHGWIRFVEMINYGYELKVY